MFLDKTVVDVVISESKGMFSRGPILRTNGTLWEMKKYTPVEWVVRT